MVTTCYSWLKLLHNNYVFLFCTQITSTTYIRRWYKLLKERLFLKMYQQHHLPCVVGTCDSIRRLTLGHTRLGSNYNYLIFYYCLLLHNNLFFYYCLTLYNNLIIKYLNPVYADEGNFLLIVITAQLGSMTLTFLPNHPQHQLVS